MKYEVKVYDNESKKFIVVGTMESKRNDKGKIEMNNFLLRGAE